MDTKGLTQLFITRNLYGFTQKVCEMGLVPENKLLAENTTYLKKGEVLEYSKIYYNQKKYRFKLIAEGD